MLHERPCVYEFQQVENCVAEHGKVQIVALVLFCSSTDVIA